jgi:hypothetical protein
MTLAPTEAPASGAVNVATHTAVAAAIMAVSVMW